VTEFQAILANDMVKVALTLYVADQSIAPYNTNVRRAE
jgi:hypothetical protein